MLVTDMIFTRISKVMYELENVTEAAILKKDWLNNFLYLFGLILFFMPACPAFAALGEHESTICAESVRMHAQRAVSAKPAYSITDLRTGDGSKVRQYISENGMVFAVSWNTLYKPDLSTLLGVTYSAYVAAAHNAAKRQGIQRNFRHESLDVVVQSTSHLNIFSGFAFRLSMLPKGFNLNTIGQE